MSESQSELITVHGLRFEIAAMSEQGPRSENQDAFSTDHFADMGIVAVADGMGGERSGRLRPWSAGTRRRDRPPGAG